MNALFTPANLGSIARWVIVTVLSQIGVALDGGQIGELTVALTTIAGIAVTLWSAKRNQVRDQPRYVTGSDYPHATPEDIAALHSIEDAARSARANAKLGYRPDFRAPTDTIPDRNYASPQIQRAAEHTLRTQADSFRKLAESDIGVPPPPTPPPYAPEGRGGTGHAGPVPSVMDELHAEAGREARGFAVGSVLAMVVLSACMFAVAALVGGCASTTPGGRVVQDGAGGTQSVDGQNTTSLTMTGGTWAINAPGNGPSSGFQADATGLDEASANNAPARIGFTVPGQIVKPAVLDDAGNVVTPAVVVGGYAVMASISGDATVTGATLKDPNGNVLFQGDATIRASDILTAAAALTAETQETVRKLSGDQLEAYKADRAAFVESIKALNPTLASIIERLLPLP